MNKVKLPPRVCGKWIWLKEYSDQDTFLIFRTEISGDLLKGDVDFWLSANSSYQLFINDRLVGFGPRGHYRTDSCFIDQHNVTCFVEPGRNIIAVRVYYNQADNICCRPPGFWCQAAVGNEIVCSSGENWLVMPGDCWTGSRPQISQGNGFVQVFHAESCPEGWASGELVPNGQWQKPDVQYSIDEFPLRPELFPMPPPVISPEAPEFFCCGAGKLVNLPSWSGVRFKNSLATGKKTFAAVGYIFSEGNQKIDVSLFADDPFKLFCNNELLADAENAKNLSAELVWAPGWNRLLLLQVPRRGSMGFMVISPENNLQIKQDMLDSAGDGWCITGPLRLNIEDAVSSLSFERLRVENCSCRYNTVPDIEALLDASVWNVWENNDSSKTLTDGEFLTWRLPRVSYGFVSVSVEAGIGDIVDIAISPDCHPGMFAGNGRKRCVNTLYCRNGKTSFLQFTPSDCVYVTVFCRHSRAGVQVSQIQFRELRKEVYRQAKFRCSDDFLNKLWETGCNVQHRAISMVQTAEGRNIHDMYLWDAYVDAVNSAVILGDSAYLASGLRQFTDVQFEDGNIPVITHCERRFFQLSHMLFLPQWILHNYSFSGSVVELEKSLPALDAARKFFEAMLDPEYGMLVFPDGWLEKSARLSRADVEQGRVSSSLSSLFCRFLLSAAEVYRIPEHRKGDSFHCQRLAGNIAEKIRAYCQNDNGLFSCWADSDYSDMESRIFANISALYGGVMAAEDFENFFFEFFNYDPPFDKYGELSPFANFLFTDMMFACSQRRWIYRYLRDYWQKRFDSDRNGWLRADGGLEETSFSNGAMISPNVFLVKEILGVRHSGNGQQVLYFHPGADVVEKAEGTVPFNNGRLVVKWQRGENGDLDVTLESNVPVTIMPELSTEHLKKTSFALSEQITLIKPPEDFEDDLEF